MAINKTSNDYADLIRRYSDIPKAVFAALAVSFALRLNEENLEEDDEE